MATRPGGDHTVHKPSSTFALTVGSVGVVYGDIGTSPLYALREGLAAATEGAPAGAGDVTGIVSLLLWLLIIIVTFKYVALILRADNRGEGGTLSLLALCQRAFGGRTRLTLALGIIGTALFFGDAMITPAISVLSAVEGLSRRALRHMLFLSRSGLSLVFSLCSAKAPAASLGFSGRLCWLGSCYWRQWGGATS